MSLLPRTTLASLAALATLAVTTGLLAVPAPTATAAPTPDPVPGTARTTPAPDKPGTVLRQGPLKRSIWVPGTTSKAFKLTYVTTDAFGERTTSTGTVMYPKGTPPKGGWPVLAWAHGTSGLGDSCAPSRVGPAFKERDWAYLSTWMKQGYALVASDYAGLGTPGKHAYLDGRTTAHNVVDMVKAGHEFAADRPAAQRLAKKWVVLGQSQGAGAAIATASFATEFGGRSLDFRGGVGTGTPAYIEALVSAAGPGVLPVDASPALTTYLLYILAGMRFAHPELKINSALNATGRRLVDLAEKACDADLEEQVTGTAIGELFKQPLATLPGFVTTARAYLGMPETSFEKPVFLANGLIDTDVPMETTAAYVAVLTANGADVTFRTYPGDHNTTMAMSLPDSVPFVKKLFR